MWLGLPTPPPLNPNLAEVLKIHCSAHEGWGDISFRARGIKLDVQTRNAIRRSLKVKAKSNQTSSVFIFSYSLKSYFDVRISYAVFVKLFIRIAPVIFCSMPQCWTQKIFLFFCGPFSLLITPLKGVWNLRAKAFTLIVRFNNLI